MFISGYRCMWLVVMFDLPTETKTARRNYALFRKFLLKDGFIQMQYSVYLRHCASRENADVHLARVERQIPPAGEVRTLTVTDKQFELMQVFQGKTRIQIEKPPCQLQLF